MDPWLGLAALSIALLKAPVLTAGDPGPDPRCPEDMRLVKGRHHDVLSQRCLDERRDGKVDHCYRYQESLSLGSGRTSEIAVCMDQFEAPNRKGAPPMVLESFDSASRWCEKRGRRLCSEQEWELACEGPEHRPWAYGWAVNVKLCNSAKGWKAVDFEAFGKTREIARKESDRLWQGSPSGRYKTCVSPFGIFDLTGNVEEWVTARPERDKPGALMGGFWAKPWTGCRGTNDAHQSNFAFYETGFRCCLDPKAPSPP
ncbi:MAG: SUMF1/EgtB/PvdO family nonheme iron enzyme [Myxococcales bacterium]|nr:SUMF1/EgtB/PvdO family nonheme iron enzyme [Myxococcales bacterium]